MTDDDSVPDIRNAYNDWRAARRETDAYLDQEETPLTIACAQRLADLLEAEHRLQEQYAEFIGRGMPGGFPVSAT